MKEKLNNLGSELIKSKEVIFVLTLIWIVLFESLSFWVIASGVVTSIAVVFVTDHFLLDHNYGYSYSIGIGTLVNFFARLIYEIIVAGFQALPLVFSGKMDVQIINTQTKLKSELLINLLTSSLTLTPGSAIISKDGNKLKVLTFNPPSEDEELREVIPKELENLLKNYEEKSDKKFYDEEQTE